MHPVHFQSHRIHRRFAIVAALLLIFAGVGSLQAQTVLMDLGDNFSDMSAQNWNTLIFNQAVPDLIDDTGATTGISFTPLFWGGDFQNSANWIIYRLADVLLMKAEALSQLGQFTAANQYLNLMKNSSLGFVISYFDLTKVVSTSIGTRSPAIPAYTVLILIYLALSLIISLVMNAANRRMELPSR